MEALEPGNIDLYNRPLVKNKDGSTSTVRSLTFEQDGRHVVVPSVHPEGYIMSDADAWKQYQDTGQHLGIFPDAKSAQDFAEKLHQQQQLYYGLGGRT